MRSQSSEYTLVVLLKQCYITPRCQASRSLPINPWARTPLRNGYTRLQQRRAYHSGKNEASIDSANFVSHSESRAAPTVFKASTSTLSQSAAQQENSGGEYGVLGGGITGLSAAHYLTKLLPHAKVTIYESTDRLGGWLRSDPVEVEGGEVYFEQGPRSLRPNVGGSGLAVMELVGSRHDYLQSVLMDV
jgi:oxygen-dependent protoporphyrinogen oxidase